MIIDLFYKFADYLFRTQVAAITVVVMAAFPAWGDGRVAGRVLVDNGPLSQAQVLAFVSYRDFQNNNFVRSAITAGDGTYSLDLPAGEYYFVAAGNDGDKEYRAFHGNNPIRIDANGLWLAFLATERKMPHYRQGETAISGTLTFKGQPVSDGYVSLYLPSAKTFKGLGFKTQSVEADGSFRIPVPAGEYVVVAKKFQEGGSIKPPRRGDLVGYFPANPVLVKEGQTVSLEVPCVPKGDRSTFSNVPAIKENSLPTMEEIGDSAESGVRGRVVDTAGDPVPEIFVLAYPNRSPVFQMYHLSHGTEYSARTDSHGRFFIPVSEAGKYILVARNTLGDGPHRDEIFGLYQGDPMHALDIKAATIIDGIKIVAGRTMKRGGGEAGGQDAVRMKNPLFATDTVLLQDTIWSGVVTVGGVVSIKRGVTLTIDPGTIVRFLRLDRDRNNIGDGEIMVEGRLVARGSAEHPIIFTSAEDNPQIRDWSYVNIIATGAPNVFEFCVFQYGYSGIQLHYANAVVADCLFQHNGEGLHFNTVNLVAEHNQFSGNGVGVKFSRLEGEVLLRNNTITDNAIGIQFTQQHINAVDFDKPQKIQEFPCFSDNNIFSNSQYDFAMGDRQAEDLAVPGNWWGTVDLGIIEEKLFDKHDDVDLGRLFVAPIRLNSSERAGIRK